MQRAQRMCRSDDRIVAGVCAGVGEYYDWSIDRIRFSYVALTILTGFVPGIFAYLVLWFIIPAAPPEPRFRLEDFRSQ